MSAIAELSAAAAAWGVPLSQGQRDLIASYVEGVLAFNRKTNLTADTDPKALLLRHVADGLAAVPLLKRLAPALPRILDLGSGGGFIGFAVKIAWPEAEVTLMEAASRKYEFLNLAAARSALPGLRVVRAAAGTDNLAPRDTGFDAVLERALAPLPEALRLGLPLAGPRGFFVAYQSEAPDAREGELQKALAQLGARLREVATYRLPLEDHDRHLAVFGRLKIDP
jgi:16S rRNA (guanine527-N7)-methyltransferase